MCVPTAHCPRGESSRKDVKIRQRETLFAAAAACACSCVPILPFGRRMSFRIGPTCQPVKLSSVCPHTYGGANPSVVFLSLSTQVYLISVPNLPSLHLERQFPRLRFSLGKFQFALPLNRRFRSHRRRRRRRHPPLISSASRGEWRWITRTLVLCEVP